MPGQRFSGSSRVEPIGRSENRRTGRSYTDTDSRHAGCGMGSGERRNERVDRAGDRPARLARDGSVPLHLPRLVIWLCLTAGIVIAHRESVSIWFAAAVSVITGVFLFARQSPFHSLDNLVTSYRGLRISIARPLSRHPWAFAAALFVVATVATALPWRAGEPYLGMNPWHDSESYLLQARLIAEGRLSRPGLEHPEFFRTLHVLVTPVLCSKYPPGYPAVMAVGLLLGCVEWVPPVIVGLAIAASWLFGRRILGTWRALLATMVLATCPLVILLGMIQISNTLAFLLGVVVLGLWAGQARGRPTGRRGLLIGVLLGVLFVTRTFDAVALGLAIVVAQFVVTGVKVRAHNSVAPPSRRCGHRQDACATEVVGHSLRRAAFRRWLVMVCVGGVPGFLALLGYHHATTGEWLTSPYLIYEQQQNYTGHFLHEPVTPPPNLESLPVNVRRTAEEFNLPFLSSHTLRHLPVGTGERFAELSRVLGGPMLLLSLAVLPVAWRCRRARTLFGICVGYFALYLVHAFNQPRFMVPILPALAWAMLAGIQGVRPRRTGTLLQMLLVVLLANGMIQTIRTLTTAKLEEPLQYFPRALAELPAGPKLIFMRYEPTHSYHREYVYNEPDMDRAERILAHDLGDKRNKVLIAAYPDRRVYLYDEAARRMRPNAPEGGTDKRHKPERR